MSSQQPQDIPCFISSIYELHLTDEETHLVNLQDKDYQIRMYQIRVKKFSSLYKFLWLEDANISLCLVPPDLFLFYQRHFFPVKMIGLYCFLLLEIYNI